MIFCYHAGDLRHPVHVTIREVAVLYPTGDQTGKVLLLIVCLMLYISATRMRGGCLEAKSGFKIGWCRQEFDNTLWSIMPTPSFLLRPRNAVYAPRARRTTSMAISKTTLESPENNNSRNGRRLPGSARSTFFFATSIPIPRTSTSPTASASSRAQADNGQASHGASVRLLLTSQGASWWYLPKGQPRSSSLRATGQASMLCNH